MASCKSCAKLSIFNCSQSLMWFENGLSHDRKNTIQPLSGNWYIVCILKQSKISLNDANQFAAQKQVKIGRIK